MSETEKYLALTQPWCVGCGIDIASQGAVVVPWAISFDLPEDKFLHYSGGQPAKGPIHLRGDCRDLPLKDGVLAWTYASHIIEDFPLDEWPALFREWSRVVKPGGHLIVLAPEKGRWQAYLRRGGIPNCQHRHEPRFGELSQAALQAGLTVVMERLTDLDPTDYTILAIFRKP